MVTTSIEDLEDDDAWSKVERGKRKALLRRERDALAGKLRVNFMELRHLPNKRLYVKVVG